MERRHQPGLRSYDRLFPNQDTMPAGGFGNLIALPLQKVPRRAGNSVFVDDYLEPFPDQWRYLTEIPRMEKLGVERLVQGLERNGNVVGVRMSLTDEDSTEDPWLLPPSRRLPEKPIVGPLPRSVRILRANLLFVEKKGLPEAMLNRLRRHCDRVILLKGGMTEEERVRLMQERVIADAPRIVVATGSYIGEGFDDPRLDTLFLAMPISWRDTLQQYVGRRHRLHDSKKIVEVYDYVDSSIPMLARMFEKRLRGYKALVGYLIHEADRAKASGFTRTKLSETKD
jgi:hypothetical protein